MAETDGGEVELPEHQTLELAGRHRLVIERMEQGNTLRLHTPDGSIPISIEVTSSGVALRIDAGRIALHASGELNLSAARLTLEGRQELVLSSGGGLELSANGILKSSAQAHTMRADRGSVDIKASDDVKLGGERVLVNCDETIDRYYRDPPSTVSGSQPPKSSE